MGSGFQKLHSVMWIGSAFSSSLFILNQFSYFKVIWGWLWCYRRERTSMSKNWLQKEISTPVTLSPHTLTFRWVAVNTVDFFNQINMLYGTITEFCTEQSCTVMSAGPKYEVRIQQLSEDESWYLMHYWISQYHWADGNQVKKPIKCSAPKYIDFLMTWVQVRVTFQRQQTT